MSGGGLERRDPESSFKLEVGVSVSVGYNRRRSVLAGKWEGPLTSLVLLIAGATLVVLVVLKVLNWLPF